jgi:hypothetical protein
MRVERRSTEILVHLTFADAEALSEVDGSDDGEASHELQELLTPVVNAMRDEEASEMNDEEAWDPNTDEPLDYRLPSDQGSYDDE